ncbi:C5 [Eupatorium yellow vein virus - [Yamaguchi]]|uniref:C5 protein n=1 Tax=Eupatorium yellow vein virus - [Yamaguchi] TaxID=269095 RepID=Q80IL9_9GEMI|nr:C5 [Eupatorium yellow vein virus - [Yamaguchi]]BAC66132.1 C5 [Eupatorium yellow vein virus - [Yamaguchi]]
MTNIVFLLKRLDLTRAFTTLRNIRASVHSVHPGLPIHGPLSPCSPSVCDEDSGGIRTADIRAVEVEPATYLGGGCGNHYIGRTLRHSSWHERLQ